MEVQIREVNEYRLFEQLIRTVWKAYHHPYKPYFSAYNPVFGPTPADREAAILDSVKRKWEAHIHDPSSKWICALNKNGDVVGGCQWKFYKENPYADSTGPLPYDASMWPEGSTGREFVETLLKRQYAHRRRWLNRKHAVCQQMSVHPQYRRQGVAKQLTQWGMRYAETQGLPVFLHASEDARWIYERQGLRVLQKVEIDMEKENPSDEWQRLRHDFGPLRFYFMWKPLHEVYKEGESSLPWESSLIIDTSV